MKKSKIELSIVVSIFLIIIFSSCVNTKKVVYFNSINDTSFVSGDASMDPVIQKGDLLSISVSSVSPEASVVFNLPNQPTVPNTTNSGLSGGSAMTSQSLVQAVGYLVGQDGNIQFPLLGNLHIEGLTKKQLSDELYKKLTEKKLLFDPIIGIRYLNFHVTVLGEVNRPGSITLPNEQVSLLEAIGMAGDLTIYGKRNNVLLIRKENGKEIIRRLDLNSEKILASPYYYLKTNDVIYVEPGKSKIAASSRGQQLLPYFISGLSVLIILLDRIKF